LVFRSFSHACASGVEGSEAVVAQVIVATPAPMVRRESDVTCGRRRQLRVRRIVHATPLHFCPCWSVPTLTGPQRMQSSAHRDLVHFVLLSHRIWATFHLSKQCAASPTCAGRDCRKQTQERYRPLARN
jgi:hypothetical protein